MRLLIIHFEQVGFSDERPSSRPFGIEPVTGDALEMGEENVLVCLTCVERDDKEDAAIPRAATMAIIERYTAIQPSGIIIQPFAHLSSHLEQNGSNVLDTIQEIRRYLSEAGVPTMVGSYGFHKVAWFFGRTEAYAGSVAYREFPTRELPQ